MASIVPQPREAAAVTNCLQVYIADIGPADAAVDVEANLLVLSSRLDASGRIQAAKKALDRVGMEQDDAEAPWCLCGFPLQMPDCSA